MANIFIAFAVVAVIGLAAGVLLSVVSHFFGMEEDKKVKAIRECLPGINCGACGYKGCDDYAAAMANGEAKPNLCVPGAKSTVDKLSVLLGFEVEKPKDVVAFVHCNGNCEAANKKAIYDGISSCKAASMIYGGPNTCRFGCLGLGDCAAVCPSHAICMKDGIAHVLTDRCLGCGLCRVTCPQAIISMVPQETSVVVMCSSKDKGADARKACKNACIGCKKCEKNCPEQALVVKNNLAIIDYDKCTRCNTCANNCPTDCLKKVFFPDIPEKFEENEFYDPAEL